MLAHRAQAQTKGRAKQHVPGQRNEQKGKVDERTHLGTVQTVFGQAHAAGGAARRVAVEPGQDERRNAYRHEVDGGAGDNLVGFITDAQDRVNPAYRRADNHCAQQTQPGSPENAHAVGGKEQLELLRNNRRRQSAKQDDAF